MSSRRLRDYTLGQLYEFGNRAILDRVTRALSIELDEDYLGALDALQIYAESAAQFAGHDDSGFMPLWAIIERSPMTLDTLERDVGKISKRAAAAEMTITLDRNLPDEPEGEVDERGQVLLDAGADRGALLADPVTLERNFQAARQLSDEYTGHDGRERFERDNRAFVEGGVSLVGTLEARRRESAVQAKTLTAERAQLAREYHERRRRAEKRRRETAIRALGRHD